MKLFLELVPVRVASIHWKNKDYFVGISVLHRLLLTTRFPLLSKLSEVSITARKKKKKMQSFPVLRVRVKKTHCTSESF